LLIRCCAAAAVLLLLCVCVWLVVRQFPRLEKLCNERGVFFAPLDLRWGVTSEQSGSGQVIKICLEEINQSRPYFVCSLGFRNGWALSAEDDPDNDGVQLLLKTFAIAIDSFPWVSTKYDRSVTEIEILHGALNSVSPRAFFYFRDASYLTSLPEKERGAYVEMGVAEERIQNLKRAIVDRGYSVRWFKTPQENADLIEEGTPHAHAHAHALVRAAASPLADPPAVVIHAVWRADLRLSIEEDFPRQTYSALEREVRDHKGFAEMRTRVHVGGDAYRKTLDDYLFGAASHMDNRPVVVCGESGCGKSALLSNWIFGLKKNQKGNG
jgi:nephrocystin-3